MFEFLSEIAVYGVAFEVGDVLSDKARSNMYKVRHESFPSWLSDA